MDLSKHAPLKINDIRSKYKVIDKVGKGTYGTVYKVLNLQDNKFYAIKKFQNTEAKLQVQGFPITALRQISLLKQLNHPNIINLIQIICSKPNKRNLYRGSTFMVFQYMHHDFSGLFRSKIKFSLSEIKSIMKQLLEGCNFLHQNKIMHRDIKSANILLNDQGVVQLADFGLGRRTRFDNIYTYKVVTLWYRAPELLLGCKAYNHKVDVWSIGCVFAQFLINEVLFKKQTQYALVEKIYQLCGDLQENQYTEDYLRGCVYYHDMKPKKSYKNILQSYIKKLNSSVDDVTLRFLKGLLQLNPYKRFSCQQALDHQFFKKQPFPCTSDQIHKLDVQYHQMFRDRSLKIERKKQARKQSLDWSQQEQKRTKQKVKQKSVQAIHYKQNGDRYEKNYHNGRHDTQKNHDTYDGQRKYQHNKNPINRLHQKNEKYESKSRKQYSISKSKSSQSESSSSSSSSHSRSRNKRHRDERQYRDPQEKDRKHKSYSNYTNEKYRQKEYSYAKEPDKLVIDKQKSYEKGKSVNGYEKQKKSNDRGYHKDYSQQQRYQKYEYREKSEAKRHDYIQKYQKRQVSPSYKTFERHQRYARQEYQKKPYLKTQDREKYDQSRNFRGIKYEDGQKSKKENYNQTQRYDKVYEKPYDKVYEKPYEKSYEKIYQKPYEKSYFPRENKISQQRYDKQYRESKVQYPRKQYYHSTQKQRQKQKYSYQDRRERQKDKQYRDKQRDKQYRDKQREYRDRDNQRDNYRKDYKLREYHSSKPYYQKRSSPQRRKPSPQYKRSSLQGRRLSPQRKKQFYQRKRQRYSPSKKFMDIQQY